MQSDPSRYMVSWNAKLVRLIHIVMIIIMVRIIINNNDNYKNNNNDNNNYDRNDL